METKHAMKFEHRSVIIYETENQGKSSFTLGQFYSFFKKYDQFTHH